MKRWDECAAVLNLELNLRVLARWIVLIREIKLIMKLEHYRMLWHKSVFVCNLACNSHNLCVSLSFTAKSQDRIPVSRVKISMVKCSNGSIPTKQEQPSE